MNSRMSLASFKFSRTVKEFSIFCIGGYPGACDD